MSHFALNVFLLLVEEDTRKVDEIEMPGLNLTNAESAQEQVATEESARQVASRCRRRESIYKVSEDMTPAEKDILQELQAINQALDSVKDTVRPLDWSFGQEPSNSQIHSKGPGETKSEKKETDIRKALRFAGTDASAKQSLLNSVAYFKLRIAELEVDLQVYCIVCNIFQFADDFFSVRKRVDSSK